MQNKVIGQYNGKDIYAGTDAEVSAQMFGSTKPTPNYSITSENIKPVVPTPIASTKENVDYGTLLNTSTAQVEANYEAQKKEVERFYEQAKNESKSISDLNYLLGNKEQDLNNEYSRKGADGKSVYDLESDLGRLTAESKSLSRERDMIPSIVQEQFKNTGATDRGVAPIETGKLRENALRNMDIAYQSDIMTNRFNSAVKMADRIVDVKYKKLEAEIEAKKTNLASLEKYDLSPAEKRLAESTSRKLELEKEELNRKKENEKLMQNLIIKGAEQGAPRSILDGANKAKTPQEVAIALGPWAGDYWQNQKLELELKKLRNESSTTFFNSGDLIQGFENTTSITADQITQALSLNETGGGKNVRAGASGELASEFQYMPSTWNRYSQEYNNAINGKNSPIPFSRGLETEVTKWKVQKWLDAGYNAVQIAAMWNGGEGAANNWKSKVGVNSKGVKYDVPAYVNSFAKHLSSVSGIQQGGSQVAQSWLKQFNEGLLSAEEIYTKIGNSKENVSVKNEVANLIAAQGGKRVFAQDSTAVEKIQEQIDSLKKVINNRSYKAISGAIQGTPFDLFGTKGNALTLVSSVLQSETLNQLADAKAKGITFGALSNAELNAVASAAGRLQARAIKEDGQITGFRGSQAAFIDDAEILIKNLQKSIINKTGGNNIYSSLVDQVENVKTTSDGYIPKDVFVNSIK
jgi:hypothetical protein